MLCISDYTILFVQENILYLLIIFLRHACPTFWFWQALSLDQITFFLARVVSPGKLQVFPLFALEHLSLQGSICLQSSSSSGSKAL